MKKTSKLVMQLAMIALFAIVLAACGKQQSATYELEESGVEMEITLNSKGDKVYEQIFKTTVPYSSFGITNKEDAKEQIGETLPEYKDLKGVKQKVDYSDDNVSLTYTLDLKKIDYDEVEEKLNLEYDEDAKKHGVSFKATTKELEKENWTKK